LGAVAGDRGGTFDRVQITKKKRLDLMRGVWLFEQCSQRELDLLQRAVTQLDVPAGRALS
jgi:hypothetical protein